MTVYRSIIFAAFGFLCFITCQKSEKKEDLVLEKAVNIVKAKFAPDKRVALFNVDISKEGDTYILNGESNVPEAVSSFKKMLVEKNIAFEDQIQELPSKELEDYTTGLITISVANLRSNPVHSAELATQATLGTPVRILKKNNGWYLIQTPDKYLAWVDAGGLAPMTEQQLNNWRESSRILYTNTYGHSYKGPEKENIVSDLVSGNILEILKVVDQFYIVRYPDGRQAYISKDEAVLYDTWSKTTEPNGNILVTTAKQLMGVPYLWGGTSTKGVDCSGFTKTVYFLNGLIIPRDASQQVHTGKEIDSQQNFDDLVEGDLLFFGRKATDSTKEKVVHVGMWIGNNEFIHASEMVRISSMDKEAPNYDVYNFERYLRTKRIIGQPDDQLILLSETSIFKD